MKDIWWGITFLCTAVAISTAQESHDDFFPEPVTDAGRYSSEFAPALHRLSRGKHFPDSIPPEATDIVFLFMPKVLQGAEVAILSYRLPVENIAIIKASLSKQAVHVFQITPDDYRSYGWRGQDTSTVEGKASIKYYLDIELPLPPSPDSVYDIRSVPQQATILYLGSTVDIGTSPVNWNHGSTFGVVIQDTTRISYWAERW